MTFLPYFHTANQQYWDGNEEDDGGTKERGQGLPFLPFSKYVKLALLRRECGKWRDARWAHDSHFLHFPESLRMGECFWRDHNWGKVEHGAAVELWVSQSRLDITVRPVPLFVNSAFANHSRLRESGRKKSLGRMGWWLTNERKDGFATELGIHLWYYHKGTETS